MIGDLTEHFSWQDLLPEDGPVAYPPVRLNIPRTAQMLEEIFAAVLALKPSASLRIRTVLAEKCEYNGRLHRLGRAVDLICDGLTLREIMQAIKPLLLQGRLQEVAPIFTSEGLVLHVSWST